MKLYGITHGGSIESHIVDSCPSEEILGELKSLPHGMKIGIEILSQENLKIIEDNLTDLSEELELKSQYISSEYWNEIIKLSLKNSHEIIFLDSKEKYLEYNKALIELAKIMQEKIIRGTDNEYDYERRVMQYNERIYKAKILRRKIHEIDRDDEILKAIISNKPAVVIVGISHSDYWVANKNSIKELEEINFSSYSTDIADLESFHRALMYASYPLDNYKVRSIFTKDAIPDQNTVYERIALERAISLLNNGRIIQDRTPDFIGTWNIMTPSEGYFEVFIEDRKNNLVSGTIEDCFGSATFIGTITSTSFNFTKRYNQAALEATRKNIHYRSTKNNQEFNGNFCVEGYSSQRSFFITENLKATPIDLFFRWYKLASPQLSLNKKRKK